MANQSDTKTVRVGSESKAQIATSAGILGAIAGGAITYVNTGEPLSGGFIGFILCVALGYFNRWLGVLVCLLSVFLIIGACSNADGAVPEDQPVQTTEVEEKKEEPNIILQAVRYMRAQPNKNGVAILIADGYEDKITAADMEKEFKALFKKRGIDAAAFSYAPEDAPYSFVGFLVGELSYGPYDLKTARKKVDAAVGAFDYNAGIRWGSKNKSRSEEP